MRGKMVDEVRPDHLAQQGIAIVRFENNDLFANPTIVSNAVLAFAGISAREYSSAPHPGPLPE